jgi:replicative DNA helicase
MTKRNLPSSITSEKALLSQLLIDPSRLPDVAQQITEDCFFYGRHRAIWAAMDALNAKKLDVDAASVWGWLEEREDNRTNPKYIGKLVASEVTAVHIDIHVRILLEHHALRTLARTAESISDQARYPQEDVPDFLSRSLESVIDSTSASVAGEPVQISDGITEMLETAYCKTPVSSVRIPTGIEGIDSFTGGMINENLNLIVARPSMGKTSVICNIALGLSQQGPLLWFSFEETVKQLQFILTSIISGIPYHDMQRGYQNSPEITKAASIIAGLPIHIERQRLPVDAIVQRCLSFRGRHGGVSGVIVDHAALIPYRGKADGFRAQYEIFTELSSVPGRLGCPLIVAHQLNRSVENRPDKRPRMSDLRDAGEEPSKQIIGLYRDSVYNPESDPYQMEAIILKNKGPIGTVNLDIDIKCARIYRGDQDENFAY